ncbi:hypothetical protein KUV57_11190 [Epibacterium sp. DP7N7-1]|nr:hypothetical protein [Epibacterium sp. DP7N7-1]
MLKIVEGQARRVLDGLRKGETSIEALMGDDAFCVAMMQHRVGQGLRLPKQNPSIPFSKRLAFLEALRDDKGVAEARRSCNGFGKLMDQLREFKKIEDEQNRAYLIGSTLALIKESAEASKWAAKYLLFGESRIPQAAILLHEEGTDTCEALGIVMDLMRKQVARSMTISDRNPDTEALSFIRVGEHPSHIAFPETASPKSGTNAAIFHYEIDHPGGDFLFFNQLWPDNDPAGRRVESILDADPLFVNDMHQLMAQNSYYLQTMDIFRVPAGDTCVTLLERGGVISAAVGHDLSAEADDLLQALEGRMVPISDLEALEGFLRGGEPEGDDWDWDAIERVQEQHPDLLGNAQMGMERSSIMGAPRTVLEALMDAGDGTDAARARVEEMIGEHAVLNLPAGRYHLHVPNLASRARYNQGIAGLDAAVGRKTKDLWFVLADRPLDLGEDPHMMTSMRRLAGEPPVQPEPDDPTLGI